jgi:hypothetical protein
MEEFGQVLMKDKIVNTQKGGIIIKVINVSYNKYVNIQC